MIAVLYSPKFDEIVAVLMNIQGFEIRASSEFIKMLNRVMPKTDEDFTALDDFIFLGAL